MKTLSFILAIAALGFFIACEFDEEPFVEEVPEEFTGANIFQCKINGEEFTANRTQATFETSDFITISGNYTSSPTDFGEGIWLSIRVEEDNTIEAGVYDISECPDDFCYNSARGGYHSADIEDQCYFSPLNHQMLGGQIDLQFLGKKEIDGRERKIMGGTFELEYQSLETDSCEVIKVTEGYFDLQYLGAVSIGGN